MPYKDTEKEREYQREYRSRPDVKRKHNTIYRKPGSKEKAKEYQKEYRIKNETKFKEYKCKNYGITLKDWTAMFDLQNGCCAICGVPQSKLKKSLYIDHCHITGKVRGLLCYGCNTILGYSKDSIEMLDKAIEYIKRNS
jgi:hypothetical protein